MFVKQIWQNKYILYIPECTFEVWYIFYVFENKYFTVKSYKNIDHDTAVTKGDYGKNVDQRVPQ